MARPCDPRRRRRALLLVALAAFALLRPVAPADARPVAPAAPQVLQLDLVTGFIDQINLLRGTLGLGRLTVSGSLTSVASGWARQMASENRLYHNPNLGDGLSGWSILGENVGVGYDVLGLMDAFIGSPTHYANLVNPQFTHVGVGVANGPNGTIYTTHDFMRLEPEPAPEPAPEPEPTPDPTPRRAPRPSAPAPDPAPAPPPAQVAPVLPTSQPTEARVAALLAPLRSLEVERSG